MIIIILITISLISLSSFAFVNLGKWLLISDPLPEKLDVIFVFGGTLSRARYALRLKDKYPDVRIIINNSKNRIIKNLDISNVLAKEGINTDNVLSVGIDTIRYLDTERNVKSGTYLEVLYLKQWLHDYLTKKTQTNNHLENKKMVNVGLVSDGFHMRRIKLLVDKIFDNTKFNLYYLPTKNQRECIIDKKKTVWLMENKNQKSVLKEMLKYIYSLIFISK